MAEPNPRAGDVMTIGLVNELMHELGEIESANVEINSRLKTAYQLLKVLKQRV